MCEEFNVDEYKKRLNTSRSIKDCPKVPIPQIGEEQNYIFVSYSHKDYKRVYSDLADMYNAGVRFWYDKGLSAGKNWEEEVKEKLCSVNCVGVIFFMSKNLFLSKSANREIEIVCNNTAEVGSKTNSLVNYFSVNLTNKMPIQVLSEAFQHKSEEVLDMSMISVLSKAFPDNATYLHYDSPEHTKELISQIKSQFGVISTFEDSLTLFKNTNHSSVFICSEFPSPSKKLLETMSNLCTSLNNSNITTYLAKGYGWKFADEIDDALKKWFEQEITLEIENAQHLIIFCSPIGAQLCFRAFGEFDSNAIQTKNIFYVILNECYGDDEEFCCKYYEYLDSDESCKALRNKVFWGEDSEEKLIEAIKSLMTAE